MNLPAMLIAADPVLADIASGGAPATAASAGNSSTFFQTLSELRGGDAPAAATDAPESPVASPNGGPPVAATLAAAPGEIVPPGAQLAVTITALPPAQPVIAEPLPVPEDAIVDADRVDADRGDDLGKDDAKPAAEPADTGGASFKNGFEAMPMRDASAFMHQAVSAHAYQAGGQAFPQTQTGTGVVTTESNDAVASSAAANRADAGLPAAIGKPPSPGTDAGILLRADFVLSHHAPAEKGADAPSRNTGDLIGISLSDLAVRDGAPRSLVADSRDAGMLMPNRPGFADALGQRIAWFARNDGGNARLELDPPHLGPLEVSVRVDKGEASVVFVASQASVREAVSQAIPELRNLLAQSGLSLGDVNVSAGGAGQHAFASPYAFQPDRLSGPDAETLIPDRVANMRHGLVDLYA